MTRQLRVGRHAVIERAVGELCQRLLRAFMLK